MTKMAYLNFYLNTKKKDKNKILKKKNKSLLIICQLPTSEVYDFMSYQKFRLNLKKVQFISVV